MDVEARIADLERRLRKAEDHLEIQRLLASYGPLVDSGEAAAAARLWADGGTYDFGGGRIASAPQEIAGMFGGDSFRRLVENGVAHLTATPRIVVRDDDAEAVGFSFVIVREGDGWHMWRAAINHWTLMRTDQGWRIEQRYNRTLDGSAESVAAMRRALRD